MPRRPKIGDIIEFRVDDSLGYAQFSHWDDNLGHLLRVFPGIHSERPSDLQALADRDEQFYTFYLLGRGVRSGAVRIVGSASIPNRAQPFPVLRSGGPMGGGIVAPWFLWDGTREWQAESLTDEVRVLSKKEIVGLPVIVERVKTGWRPGDDTRE